MRMRLTLEAEAHVKQRKSASSDKELYTVGGEVPEGI